MRVLLIIFCLCCIPAGAPAPGFHEAEAAQNPFPFEPLGTNGADNPGVPGSAAAAGDAAPAPSSAEPAASTPAPAVEAIQIPVGERLVYRATVDKIGISAEVGTAEFTITEDGDHQVVLAACAKGEKFGYVLDTTLRTVLASGTNVPVLHHFMQRGSEYREKKLIFSDQHAAFWKLKHCNGASCSDSTHAVSKTYWVGGVIPWGSHDVHCTDKDCGNTQHLVWSERASFALERPHLDMLSAIYAARELLRDAGTRESAPVIAVINDRDLWDVKILFKRLTKCTVAAGTFDAIEIALEPVASADATVRDEFRGLFGLHGTIRIWVDQEKRRPLLVKGSLPFGPMNLNASAELIEIGTVPLPADPAGDSAASAAVAAKATSPSAPDSAPAPAPAPAPKEKP